ncbi:SPASM domain-containing protein [Sphingobium scionense]
MLARTGKIRAKSAALPTKCRSCDYLRLCYGECPKNRLIRTREGRRASTISVPVSTPFTTISGLTSCISCNRWAASDRKGCGPLRG